MAANYLDVKGLLDDACMVVAKSLKHKPPQMIREMLNIEKDLTEEQHAKILRQLQWGK